MGFQNHQENLSGFIKEHHLRSDMCLKMLMFFFSALNRKGEKKHQLFKRMGIFFHTGSTGLRCAMNWRSLIKLRSVDFSGKIRKESWVMRTKSDKNACYWFGLWLVWAHHCMLQYHCKALNCNPVAPMVSPPKPSFAILSNSEGTGCKVTSKCSTNSWRHNLLWYGLMVQKYGKKHVKPTWNIKNPS